MVDIDLNISLSMLNVNEECKEHLHKSTILSYKARQQISKEWNRIDCVL